MAEIQEIDPRPRRAARAAIGLFMFVVLMYGGGLLLPANAEFRRTADIEAEPDTVHASLAAPQEWSHWSPWFNENTMESEPKGPGSGRGARATWKTNGYETHELEITDSTENSISYSLRFLTSGYEATGKIAIATEGARRLEKTRLEWRCHVDVGYSPFARYALFARESLFAPELERGLRRLRDSLSPPTGSGGAAEENRIKNEKDQNGDD